MRKKNELLPALQEQFENALSEGRILGFAEITAGAGDWLKELTLELNA